MRRMQCPKMILFDYGHTLIYEEEAGRCAVRAH